MLGLLKGFMVIACLFGFSCGAYLAFFKMPQATKSAQIFSFVLLGALITGLTTLFSLMLVWPPVM